MNDGSDKDFKSSYICRILLYRILYNVIKFNYEKKKNCTSNSLRFIYRLLFTNKITLDNKFILCVFSILKLTWNIQEGREMEYSTNHLQSDEKVKKWKYSSRLERSGINKYSDSREVYENHVVVI